MSAFTTVLILIGGVVLLFMVSVSTWGLLSFTSRKVSEIHQSLKKKMFYVTIRQDSYIHKNTYKISGREEEVDEFSSLEAETLYVNAKDLKSAICKLVKWGKITNQTLIVDSGLVKVH